jgi:transaldolase
MNIENLDVKIFADGADKLEMLRMNETPYISGLTTNPTLMRKAKIQDYKAFCLDVLQHVKQKPISFEVFSDDLHEMERQALEISKWGENVYVKIPITNTKKKDCIELVQKLVENEVKVNVTAIMTLSQVESVVGALSPEVPSYISVFAGRIADTGIDPTPVMKSALKVMKKNPLSELIWASPRELLNVVQASEIGCHIITVTPDILKKLTLLGYDLDTYSLDTVKMFYRDACDAGYTL